MINKISDEIIQMCFSQFGSCVYFLKLGDGRKVIIDTSTKKNKDELLEDLGKLEIDPVSVDILILTHTHWDHVENAGVFSNAEIFNNENIDDLKIDGMEVFRCPGHTFDSIALLYKKFLFSGDTLFHGSGIGRTDLEESEPEKMDESLALLRGLDYDVLCPGHV
jgi:glyoxylase-like metal-dependent hydrolase (beta-lactamase superfamily II)